MFLTAAPATASPDGRRAGATWVAATGAFLLVAAAAVFIAVRWDTLPEPAKLALVAALTGGFLAGGRALRRTLPATGDVLFHLGAFLIPVDVAGLCVRADVGWRGLLLGEGVAGLVALGALALATRSVVLGWAAAASVVVLAAGVAAVSPLPAPLLLAGGAVLASALGLRKPAVAWATIAGLAPVLAAGIGNLLAAAAGRDLGAGTLSELGLAGASPARWLLASGVVSAAVLGRAARQRKDLALVALAGLSLVSGAGTAWAAADPSDDVTFLTLPAIFVAVQVVAMLTARDEFWRRPSRALAIVSEVLAAVAAPIAAVVVLVAPLVDEGIDLFSDGPPWEPQLVGATAWSLTAAGWLIAGWRRQSPKPTLLAAMRAAIVDDRTVVFLFLAAAAAVVLGTASTPAIAAVLLAASAGLLLSRGVLATAVGIGAALWAPVVLAPTYERSVIVAALGATAVLALGAREWRHATNGAPAAIVLTAAATIAAIGGGFHAVDHDLGVAAAMLIAVFACWGVAVTVEGASRAAAHVARAAMFVPGAAAFIGTSGEAFVVVAAVTLLIVVEAVRVDDPRIAFATTLTVPTALFTASDASGLATADSGVVLAIGAVVLTGLASLAPERWRLPVLTAAAASIGCGLPLASEEPARFAETLILTGGLVLGAGLTLRHAIAAHAGAATATLGIALHLSIDGVTATEPYLAPVALHLLVLGIQLRRRADDAPSSWIAFGPSIALLGAAALVERMDGGPTWHALVAGLVGVTAVAAGGWKRLAGPLFIGTGLLVAVTVLETLHTLAGVPTWAWLAAGGSFLLLTGIALERSATSPSEAGRRLVDVVTDRFE